MSCNQRGCYPPRSNRREWFDRHECGVLFSAVFTRFIVKPILRSIAHAFGDPRTGLVQSVAKKKPAASFGCRGLAIFVAAECSIVCCLQQRTYVITQRTASFLIRDPRFERLNALLGLPLHEVVTFKPNARHLPRFG